MAHTARSGTLTASAVTTVSVGDDVAGLLINNHAGSPPIYITYDGRTPTVGGDDCYPVLGSRYFALPQSTDAVSVKLISSGAVSYTVESNPA